MRRNLPLLLTLTAFAAGCATVAPESDMIEVVAPRAIEIPLGDSVGLELRVAAGEVTLLGDDADTVRATLSIRCPAGSQRCAKWAADARLHARQDREQVVVTLDAPARFNSEVRLELRVPRHNPVKIDMGYGELRAADLEHDLEVDMKAGEVNITMPAQAVGQVQLAARFGDATLHLDGRSVEAQRPWMVGARVDWYEGQGSHDVDVRLRFGDVQVALQRE